MNQTKEKNQDDKNEEILDVNFDNNLRPQEFSDFIGQKKAKKNFEIITKAAKLRGESLEHILIYGPPGLGKTTLAQIIARFINTNIKVTSGPAIERSGDLASILTNLSDNDILFIDEIHRLNKNVEEILYPAMEDYSLDLVLGKGPSAKTLRIDLPKFTLIGATTQAGLISSPMRDRFGLIERLNYYEVDEIEKIVERSAKILKISIDKDAVKILANCSRRTPRLANRLLKRARDYAQVENAKIINLDIAKACLKMMEIDDLGLDKIDMTILHTIIDKYSGGPVGLETIAASVGEDVSTISDIYEPYLMQIGFLDRTTRGRKVTTLAYRHLGLDNKNTENNIL